jgi:hypothetical protein
MDATSNLLRPEIFARAGNPRAHARDERKNTAAALNVKGFAGLIGN